MIEYGLGEDADADRGRGARARRGARTAASRCSTSGSRCTRSPTNRPVRLLNLRSKRPPKANVRARIAEDRRMRLRFWIGLVAAIVVGAGAVVGSILVYDHDSSEFHTRQRKRRSRAARQAQSVGALSVGELAAAAAFIKADGNTLQARVRGRRPVAGQAKNVLHAAAFIDVVHADERARVRTRTGLPDRRNAAPTGSSSKRARASVYYPLTYTRLQATKSSPPRRCGFDVGTDPERAPYLQRAAEDGRATATRVIPLLVGGTGSTSTAPVYRDGAPTATAAERRRALIGFAARQLPAQGPRRGRGHHAAGRRHRPARRRRPDRDRRRRERSKTPAAARIQIADRTWLLVVRDPEPARRQPADPLRRRRAGAGRGARLADLGLEPRGADAGAAARGRRRLAQRAADAAALRGGGAGGDGALEPRRDHRRAADARPRPLQDGQRLLRAPGRRQADRGGRRGAAQARPARATSWDGWAATSSRSRCRAAGPTRPTWSPRRSSRRSANTSPTTARSSRSPCSVGVANFGIDQAMSYATLLSEADTAMYAAKDAGGDGFRVFHPDAIRVTAPSGRR